MPRVKLFNEEEVLSKAIQLFWKKGFHATSIQDLVDFLGINRASLYDTFGDKRLLFDKAFQQYRKTGTENIQSLLKEHAHVKEGLRKLFESAIDESVSDLDRKGCFVVNTTTELLPGDMLLQEALEENKRTFEKILYDYLEKGVSNKEIDPDKDLLAIAGLLFTLYSGLKVIAKVEPDKKKLLASVNAALALLD